MAKNADKWPNILKFSKILTNTNFILLLIFFLKYLDFLREYQLMIDSMSLS